MTDYDYDYLYKIVMIGESGVGKTNLVTRFISDIFNPNARTTVGVDFLTKSVVLAGHKIKAQLWDTAGQERFRAVASASYRGAKGAVVCYDITNYASFQAVQKWVDEFRRFQGDDSIILLVGNKLDLRHIRAVSEKEAVDFSNQHDLLFIETSALDTTNVEKAFMEIIGRILEKSQQEGRKVSALTAPTDEQVIQLQAPKRGRRQRGCC